MIIISAKNSLEDKIKGSANRSRRLSGKPFHLSELAARIYSIIRRKQFGNSNIIEQNEVKVNLLAKTVSVNEKEVLLTKKNLICCFISLATKTGLSLRTHWLNIFQEI